MQNYTYQFTTPIQSPAEISVTEVLGIHVLPTIKNNWLDTLSPKAFIGWLQLLSLAMYEENRAKEGEIVRYPTKKEVLEKLGMAESTFNKNIMKPLFEYGLLTVEDVPGSDKLNKRGLPNRRIIVYRYPLNRKENLLKPLVKLYDYENDYNSKAKSFGIMGANEKKKLQIEADIMKQYEEQHGNLTNVDNGDKEASKTRSNHYPQALNSESNSYPQASSFKSLYEGQASSSRSNDSDAGSGDVKLRESEALDIYYKTSSNNITNSFNLLKEKEINNIFNNNASTIKSENFGINTEAPEEMITEIYKFMDLPKVFLSHRLQLFVERLVNLGLDFETIKDIVAEIILTNRKNGEYITILSANEQIDFMLEEIRVGRKIHNFYSFFKVGFKSLMGTNLIKQQQQIQSEAVLPTHNEPEPYTPPKVKFYNWLDERE